MASGFVIASGADLDMVFAPQHSGWPQASATEFFDGSGNDLNLRYAPLSTGGIASANTEFVLSSGADLITVFAAYGSTNVQVLTQPSNISGSADVGVSGTVTSNSTTCAGTKGGGVYTYTWHIANGSGFSFTAPNSATTAVTGTVSANSTMTGSIYCTISDGVSSVNTNAVSISLTNTYTLVSVGTQPSNVSGSSAAGDPSGTVTSSSTSCAGAGGYGSYTYTWHTSGCTANSPNSASTDFYATVNAASTDNASAYCTISDGASSINTNTIAVALTNTTPAAVMGQIVAGTVTNSTGIFTGFDDSPNGYGIGSWSVTSGTIPNGGSIQTLYDALIGSKAPYTAGVVLSITDLSADPGQDWFTTVVSNGVSLSASAATYSYSSGVATWNWSSTSFGFSSGTTYPVQLNL